jgi:hypothetical protein
LHISKNSNVFSQHFFFFVGEFFFSVKLQHNISLGRRRGGETSSSTEMAIGDGKFSF